MITPSGVPIYTDSQHDLFGYCRVTLVTTGRQATALCHQADAYYNPIEGTGNSGIVSLLGNNLVDVYQFILTTKVPQSFCVFDIQRNLRYCISAYFLSESNIGLTYTAIKFPGAINAARAEENEAFVKGIAEAAPDMLYIIDLKSLAIVFANGRMLQLLGKSMVELQALGAKIFDDIVYPEDRSRFDEAVSHLFNAKDNEIIELTFRLIDDNGGLHWVTTRRTVYMRNKEGEPLFALGITQEITEQMKLRDKNKKLMVAKKQAEELSRQQMFKAVLDTQEEERRRISEALHNDLGQQLYGVKISLDQAIKKSGDIAEVKELRHTEKLLSDVIRESRRMSHELMPTLLEDFGLSAALNNICEQMRVTIDCQCAIKGDTASLDKYMQTAVYRIAQELMLNIMKHSKAKKALLEVSVSKRSVAILAKDDGIGMIHPRDSTNGIGIKSIRSRVKMLAGTFENISNIQGTEILVTLPKVY